jgi:hypothetical protein
MPLDPMTDGLSRTNPNAHQPENAIQLYGVKKLGCCDYAGTFTWEVTGSLTEPEITFTPTGGATATGLRCFKWKVLDQSGNAAYGATVPPATTPVVVGLGSLNLLDPLRIEFYAEVNTNGNICSDSYWIAVPAGYVNGVLAPEAAPEI